MPPRPGPRLSKAYPATQRFGTGATASFGGVPWRRQRRRTARARCDPSESEPCPGSTPAPCPQRIVGRPRRASLASRRSGSGRPAVTCTNTRSSRCSRTLRCKIGGARHNRTLTGQAPLSDGPPLQTVLPPPAGLVAEALHARRRSGGRDFVGRLPCRHTKLQ